jgi:hypothetical protein
MPRLQACQLKKAEICQKKDKIDQDSKAGSRVETDNMNKERRRAA